MGEQTVWLTDDAGLAEPMPLRERSLLGESLAEIWNNEVQYYLVLFGGEDRPADTLETRWLALTARWIAGDRS